MRVFGICGKSREGRSELVAELVARFRMEGLRVAIVKRAPISFDIDTPGTDSFRQRESGCTQTLIASDRRLALMEEYPSDSSSPELRDLIARLKPTDIVLAVNFRDADIPRLEVAPEEAVGRPERNSRWVLARVGAPSPAFSGSYFAADEYDAIASFILANASLWGDKSTTRFERDSLQSA